MIKVYLDWNCITHCKDSLAELKELLKLYGYVFICPYGVAHLRDIQTKLNTNPKEYENDLDLLTQICGAHMLLCTGDEMKLLNVTPRDYLVDNGESLDFLQNKFNFPYDSMRKLFRSAFAPKDIHRIEIENDPSKVYSIANETVERTLGYDINTLLERFNTFGKRTLEMKMKNEYYVLDMLGYKTEDKRKSYSNIDTDAHHIFLASFCDYLVSNDSRMREKAKAIYSHCNCVTKVMDPKSFMKEMPRIVEKCYDTELIPYAMKTYGTPTIQEDGAHFKAMDYPLWGTFKFCYSAVALDSTKPDNMAIFVPGQFMFYDELRPLATISSMVLPESYRDAHTKNYIQSYIDSKPLDNITFTLDTKNYRYNCALMTYNSLPALQVICEKI